LSRREEAKAMFRNAILEAAEHVFAERGFHVARIQDVAQHARIAVGTVYNHFEQKDDLLHALLAERAEKMLERFAPAATDPPAFEQRLIARLERVLRYVDEHRSFYVVAIEHGMLAKGGATTAATCSKRVHQIERFRAVFRSLVEEGVAEGALEPMSADSLTWALGGILRSFLQGALERRQTRLESLAPTITQLFLHGAARRTPAATPSPPRPKTRRTPPSPQKAPQRKGRPAS